MFIPSTSHDVTTYAIGNQLLATNISSSFVGLDKKIYI